MQKHRIETPWTNPNTTQYLEKPQPSIHYVTDNLGQLKYVVKINLIGFLPSDIRVRQEREVVTVEAGRQKPAGLGVVDTHELKYNICLPATVILSSVRYTVDTSGNFRLEGSVKEAIRPNHVGQPKRQQPPGLTSNASKENNSLFVKSPQHGRLLRENAPTPTRDKRVSFMDASASSANDSNYQRKSVLQTALPLVLPAVSKKPATVRNVDLPEKNRQRAPQAPAKYFNLRVAIGAHFRPEDVSVSHNNGIIVIKARRVMNKLTYTHFSEHTVPGGVNVNQLSSRVENGNVVVRASFIQK